MKSIKLILAGIGFLVFSISCTLLATLGMQKFLSIPALISMWPGLICLIAGLFVKVDDPSNKSDG